MRLLLLIIAAYLAYRFLKSWVMRSIQVPGQGTPGNPEIDDVMVQDPVCGVYFPRREGVALRHGGQAYLFCSTACRDRFVKENR